MIVLDEHFLPSQRRILLDSRIRVRQIGYDIGRKGMSDEEIIPLLHRMRRPTFATLDEDYWQRDLCHPRYCLAYLCVRQQEVAVFVRRLLGHPDFDTQAKRMGAVIRLSHGGLLVWRAHAGEEVHRAWSE